VAMPPPSGALALTHAVSAAGAANRWEASHSAFGERRMAWNSRAPTSMPMNRSGVSAAGRGGARPRGSRECTGRRHSTDLAHHSAHFFVAFGDVGDTA